MNFRKTNIGNGRTAYININSVQLIECDDETKEAILTMANGDIYHTNEDYEELLHDWEIEMDSDEYENYLKRKAEKYKQIAASIAAVSNK